MFIIRNAMYQMKCYRCKGEIPAGDPVYQRKNWGGSCGKCEAARPSSPWRDPRACEHCGRAVITQADRYLPKHAVCSGACWRHLDNARQRARWKLSPRSCGACGSEFMPKRTDAEYCSAKCKQKAYRDRHSPTNARRKPAAPTTL